MTWEALDVCEWGLAPGQRHKLRLPHALSIKSWWQDVPSQLLFTSFQLVHVLLPWTPLPRRKGVGSGIKSPPPPAPAGTSAKAKLSGTLLDSGIRSACMACGLIRFSCSQNISHFFWNNLAYSTVSYIYSSYLNMSLSV